MVCSICKSDTSDPIFSTSKSISSDSFMIDEPTSNLICKSCGNVFVDPDSRKNLEIFYRDSYKLLNSSFKAESQFFSQSNIISISDWRLRTLINNIRLPDKGKILDIGCGKGNFLHQFSQYNKNWDLFGVEASNIATKFVKENLPNVHLYEGMFKEKIFDTKFDVIVALNILEHLEELDFFLQNIKDALKEDGVFLFDIPNFKLNPADLFVYDHLTHFTDWTLENLLNKNGFQIIKQIQSTDSLPFLMICKQNEQKPIMDYYNQMKKLSLEHIQFNESMFDIYHKINSTYDKIGVIGLGVIIWAAIQNNILDKSKIVAFFDENQSIIGDKKSGIEIKKFTEVASHAELPFVFSVSPCYIQNIVNKIKDTNVRFYVPENYQYFNKYFKLIN